MLNWKMTKNNEFPEHNQKVLCQDKWGGFSLCEFKKGFPESLDREYSFFVLEDIVDFDDTGFHKVDVLKAKICTNVARISDIKSGHPYSTYEIEYWISLLDLIKSQPERSKREELKVIEDYSEKIEIIPCNCFLCDNIERKSLISKRYERFPDNKMDLSISGTLNIVEIQ